MYNTQENLSIVYHGVSIYKLPIIQLITDYWLYICDGGMSYINKDMHTIHCPCPSLVIFKA